jgi:hypothetical protein
MYILQSLSLEDRRDKVNKIILKNKKTNQQFKLMTRLVDAKETPNDPTPKSTRTNPSRRKDNRSGGAI